MLEGARSWDRRGARSRRYEEAARRGISRREMARTVGLSSVAAKLIEDPEGVVG